MADIYKCIKYSLRLNYLNWLIAGSIAETVSLRSPYAWPCLRGGPEPPENIFFMASITECYSKIKAGN